MEEESTIKFDEIVYDGTILGEGKYGIVKKGTCRGFVVAVKFIKFANERLIEKLKEEINILRKIRAPNVCLFLGACNITAKEVCIVQEYLSGGDLGKLLKNKNQPISIIRRLLWGKDIARGMKWIHSANVLHRDLKLENLLLGIHSEIKVCDFGLSDFCPEGEIIVDQAIKGTPLYSAPEVFLKKEITTKVDVYSFGLILWELLANKRAFPHHNQAEKFINCICGGERPLIPPEVLTSSELTNFDWKNDDIVKLMKDCWELDPNRRPEFGIILDKLNLIILDLCFGKDIIGREFWVKNFTYEFDVPWDNFLKTLSNYFEIPQPEQKILKQILGQFEDDYTHVRGDVIVTQEIFGKLLTYFGPIIDDQKNTFLQRMIEICSNLWFHGKISIKEASNFLITNDIFLVRFSSKPGCFTVQTSNNVCFSITQENRQYNFQGRLYPSLKLLIEDCFLTRIPNFCKCTHFITDVEVDVGVYPPFL